MCAEDQTAFQQLMAAIRSDGVYRRHRAWLLFFSGLVLLAQVVVIIVLPVLYMRASEFLREFKAVDAYMSVLAESLWQVSLHRAQVTRQNSWVLDLPYLITWYDFYQLFPLARIQELATTLEFYHRCIVYGCAALNIQGVAISAPLTDYFYGATHADRNLKQLIQYLRNMNLEYLLPLYDADLQALSRHLPRLYVDNFTSWTRSYVVTIAICCSLIMAAVLGVGIRYYHRYVQQFERDVRRYRFVLQLLPAAAIDEVPFARKYLESTAWVADTVDAEMTADAVYGNDEDELNQV